MKYKKGYERDVKNNQEDSCLVYPLRRAYLVRQKPVHRKTSERVSDRIRRKESNGAKERLIKDHRRMAYKELRLNEKKRLSRKPARKTLLRPNKKDRKTRISARYSPPMTRMVWRDEEINSEKKKRERRVPIEGAFSFTNQTDERRVLTKTWFSQKFHNSILFMQASRPQ